MRVMQGAVSDAAVGYCGKLSAVTAMGAVQVEDIEPTE